jgi:hypothetical protein
MNDHSIAWMIGGGRHDLPDARRLGHLAALREAEAARSAETRIPFLRLRPFDALADRFGRRPAITPATGPALDCCAA